jgi:hypothetical protein
MIMRRFNARRDIGMRNRSVDPDAFIARLKRLRAIDPAAEKFDKEGHELKAAFFGMVKIVPRVR